MVIAPPYSIDEQALSDLARRVAIVIEEFSDRPARPVKGGVVSSTTNGIQNGVHGNEFVESEANLLLLP